MGFYSIIKHKNLVCNSKFLQIIESDSSPKHIKSLNQKQYFQISLSYKLEHVVYSDVPNQGCPETPTQDL